MFSRLWLAPVPVKNHSEGEDRIDGCIGSVGQEHGEPNFGFAKSRRPKLYGLRVDGSDEGFRVLAVVGLNVLLGYGVHRKEKE